MGEKQFFGRLRTGPLQDHSNGGTEIGEFDLPVFVDKAAFNASGDKPGMFRHTVATFLASAIRDTEVPQEYWHLELMPEISVRFNLPPVLHFNTKARRS